MLYNMGYPHDHHPAAPVAQPIKPMVAAAAAARPRPRCSQPMPFDPEELSQKLTKVLADQKLHSERRRRARAEATVAAAATAAPQGHDAHPQHASLARDYLDKGSIRPGHSTARPHVEPPIAKPAKESDASTARPKSKVPDEDRRSSKSRENDLSRRKGSDGDKHHFIPQFAAAQFARTTTAEGMSENNGLVRKLSRTALRLAQGHRERFQDRGSFQRDQIPETAEMGNDRVHRGPNHHRHTIEGPMGTGRATETDQAKATRRVSTGDLLMTWESGTSSPYHCGDAEVQDCNPYEHRVDWTQSDEMSQSRQKPKPSMRKADSIWALKSKLGAFAKHGREENHSRETSPPSDTPRSPKNGFFARFKVNH